MSENGSMFRQIYFDTREYQLARVLREAVLRTPLGLRLTSQDVYGEDTQLHFGLVDRSGGVLACVSVVPLARDRCKLRQTAVDFGQQRRGLGRRLLAALEAELVARGFFRLELHARVAASGFYAQMGYTAVGEEFLEVGLPHRRMEKRLKQEGE